MLFSSPGKISGPAIDAVRFISLLLGFKSSVLLLTFITLDSLSSFFNTFTESSAEVLSYEFLAVIIAVPSFFASTRQTFEVPNTSAISLLSLEYVTIPSITPDTKGTFIFSK